MLRTHRRLALIIFAAVAASCGGAASVSADPSPRPSAAAASPTAPPVAAAFPGALAWTVSDRSKATVKVREQLAALSFPSDAVLVARGAKGSFGLNADGTFAGGSTITFDVSSLASDQSLRDSFVKQSVLNTRQFPTATFVPTKAVGLTTPLAVAGHFSFTVAGKLTLHGVTRDATFDVDATRSGAELTASATLNPTVKFEDFGMSQPAAPGRVISVVDEIHLVVDLVATGPAT